MVDNLFISKLATTVYNFIQKIDFKDRRISRYIKENSKGWLRMSEKVFESAVFYGKSHGADYVFCGHTHKAIKNLKSSTKYYNCGCWTDIPCTYVTIDEKGINIYEY